MVGAVNLDDYLTERLHRRVTREEVALALGVSVATLGRRKAAGFTADDVIAAARRFGLSTITALVDFGYLTQADLDRAGVIADTPLHDLTDVELAEEMLRRVRAGGPHPALTEPLTDHHADVRELHPSHPGGAPVSDLYDTLADAADDAPDWEAETDGLTREP